MTTKKITGNKLALTGEMTIFTAALIKDQLMEAIQLGEDLNVDLSGVTEFDTSGLQILVSAKKLAEVQKSVLQFSEPADSVASLLRLSGMTELAS